MPKKEENGQEDGGVAVMEAPDPVPPEPTAAERKAVEARWGEKVERFLTEENEQRTKSVWHYWNRGQFVREVLFPDDRQMDLGLRKNNDEYGDYTFDDLCKAWSKGERTVQRYAQFHRDYSKAEIEEAVEQGLGWTELGVLLPLSVGHKKLRDELQKKLVSKKIDLKTAQELVTAELNKKQKDDNKKKKAKGEKESGRPGGFSPHKVFRAFVSLCSEAEKRADAAVEAYREVKKQPVGERKAETVQRFREVHKETERLIKKLQKMLTYVLE